MSSYDRRRGLPPRILRAGRSHSVRPWIRRALASITVPVAVGAVLWWAIRGEGVGRATDEALDRAGRELAR